VANRIARRVLIAVVASAACAAVVVPSVASAAPQTKPKPKPTVSSVEAQLSKLARQNTQLVERYNQAQLAVATAQKSVVANRLALQTANAPTVQVIPTGGPTTAACAGSVAHPSAAAGFMCVYESPLSNVASVDICSSAGCTATPSADPFGAEVSVHSAGAGRFSLAGTWAVTGA